MLLVGLGSNLLVRDGGFEGAVIAAHRGLREIKDLGGALRRRGRSVARGSQGFRPGSGGPVANSWPAFRGRWVARLP